MSLRVYTSTCAYRGEDRLDVTRRGVEQDLRGGSKPEGAAFAPPRWLLNAAKGYTQSVPEGVEAPPRDGLSRWRWYTRLYHHAMRETQRTHADAWEAILRLPEVTIVCFCQNAAACHRGLLAVLLVERGAIYEGER